MQTILATLAQQPFYARAYYDTTNLHPLGALIVIACGALVLALPRRSALFPFLVLVCFVSSAQRVALAGLDFNLLRILVVCGLVRQVARGELAAVRWKALDRVVLAWALVGALAFVALRGGERSAVIFQCGRLFEALGLFAVIRGFLRGWEDVERLAALFAALCVPIAVFFLIERATGRNPFALFGGVPPITAVREGRLRCNGAFAHPILAGCFFAALAGLAGSRIWSRDGRGLGIAGLIGALTVVLTSSSSTPWGAALAGLAGACLFPLRRSMRAVRWSALGVLVGLHLFMTMPVWHLLARIDLVGGSTGWHRYNLINQCVERWREWALLGVTSTAHWGIQLFDITNQYVYEAVNGGLATLVLFDATLVLAFAAAGRAWRAVEHDRGRLALAWGLGVCLWVHAVNFIGVSYFGQMQFSWYLVLGAVASLSEAVARGEGARAGPAPRPAPADGPLPSRGAPRPLPRRREPSAVLGAHAARAPRPLRGG